MNPYLINPVYHVHKWIEMGGWYTTFTVFSLTDAVRHMGAGDFVKRIDENGNLRNLTEDEQRELDSLIRKAG
jgi:hypothetical protein